MKTLLIGSSLLLAAPAAFAQGDDASGGGGGSATVGAGAEVNAGGAGASAGAGATVAAGGDAAVGWPAEMGSRPYTLLKGGLAAYGDFDIMHASITAGTTTSSFTQEQFHLGAGYGVSDKLTVGGEFSFPLAGDGTDNTKLKGPLRFYGMFGLSHSDKMTVAAEAHFELNLCGGVDTMGGCATTKAIGAGLDARYVLAPKIALFTGSAFGPGVPGAMGAVSLPGFGGASVGQHLNISLESSGPITFDVPVGVSLQATPQLLAWVAFDLMRFNLANKAMGADTVQVIFSDAQGAPMNLGGFFGVNKNLDVGVSVTDDLKHAGDLYVIALGARWTK
ncbi:MAG: hypothetical protein JO257_06085 [Deltaproteobacteria bacterium]|nr:hypothetical protein [Deltaproteobacteria bacterium]